MRTGIFEYLRKCVAQITGKDPETQDSSQLYKFYAQDTRGSMGLPASGTTPFKHSVITPVQTPPGVYYDTSGKICKPAIYDATMGDAIRVLPKSYATAGHDLGSQLIYIAQLGPESTIGGANSAWYASSADEWKWGSIQITAAADTELVAAVAGKKIQICVTSIAVIQGTTGDATVPVTCTLQDSDNTQLSGCAVFRIGSFFKTQIGSSCSFASYPWMGAVAYSATANRGIEMDVAMTGLGAADYVQVTYAWREFA